MTAWLLPLFGLTPPPGAEGTHLPPLFVGIIFASAIVLLGLGTAYRQVQVRRRLRARTLVPSDETAYVRRQTARRFSMAVLLIVIGVLIGGSYISGMEARAEGEAVGRKFAWFYAVYWIQVLVLVFLVSCLAVFDLWATRRYWLRVYRRLRNDHNSLLQRDLTMLRQQKMQSREARLRKGTGGDTTL